MLENLFFIAVGMIVGWNVLPQPAWVQRLYAIASQKVKDLFSKDED